MIDATIHIPTHRHAALLPYALSSALGQSGVALEVIVVGDGVEDDTRKAVEPFLGDPRVRFLDYPKGPRHGEAHRHQALGEAAGRIVCYLSDDDLLLADHVAVMAQLLESADFAHSARSWSGSTDRSPTSRPTSRPPGLETGFAGLAGTRSPSPEPPIRSSHTGACLTGGVRLPRGPPTDLHMWRQFLELPGFVGVSGTRLTHLHFASHWRRSMDGAARVDELERWWARTSDGAFSLELECLAARAAMSAATQAAEESVHLRDVLESVRRSWSWRLGAPFRRARALRSRPPRAS